MNFIGKNRKIATSLSAAVIGALIFASCGDKAGTESSVSNNTAVSNNGTVLGEAAVTGNGNVSSNGVFGTGILDTGNLTEFGNGYEGTVGTGTFNYGEALQKSVIFYELQRSGDIPEQTRCNWRGDSSMNDGSDVGLDLTGGWYDAGDNVKFNLPMSYSAAMLGWSLIVDYEAYEESGQLEYALGNIKWANDYFIKCHPEDEVYYYQVGNGGQDHTFWGPAEVVEYRMDRPSYCVTIDNPGSAVTGETAASLAICSILYENIDSEYSDLCLSHAESLYRFSRDSKSDAGYTAAAGFYDSWSGFYDELAWAGVWLYQATGDSTYLDNAVSDYSMAGQDYDWAMCWDDVHIGAAVMLAQLTGDSKYSDAVEKHLDWWSCGTDDGSRITYTPQGLAWLDNWGSLRYATTTAFIAAVYSRWDECPADKSDIYWDFAVSQADYALGSTGFSYEIGFGDDYPVHPHHRTAQGSYCDNMNEPGEERHTLYGALVGGPGSNDDYTDEVSNYNNNEVACDYNAGFTGLLAAMYSEYHGQTLVDFGAVEEIPINELYVTGGINVDGTDFMELKAYICNVSAWPARVPQNLEFRYYMDLSEIVNAGGDPSNVTITTNYMQGGTASSLVCWDADNNIYYMSVDFADTLIYPGGQDNYKKEIQVRISNTGGAWDNSNDPSFVNMLSGGNELLTGAALYEDGVLVFGTEPPSGTSAGTQVATVAGSAAGNAGGTNTAVTPSSTTATDNGLTVAIDYQGLTTNANSISGSLKITNNTSSAISMKDLVIKYFFTNEDDKSLAFACYYTAIDNSSGNHGISSATASFSSYSGTDSDTVCEIKYSDNSSLAVGDTLTLNFCINHSDWSTMNTGNDFSVENVENIAVYEGSQLIFGNTP